jgi:hypothetical protein
LAGSMKVGGAACATVGTGSKVSTEAARVEPSLSGRLDRTGLGRDRA